MEFPDYAVKKGQHHHHQIPSFGNWDYYDDIPVTQYFESARQAGLVRGGAAGYGPCAGHHHYYSPADADLFPRVPPSPMPYHCHNPKPLKAAPHKLKHPGNVSSREQRRQVRVCDADAYPRNSKPKAVDEDLYKIPPELLCQRRRRPNKVAMSGFWRCCLGMNCIA